ncbi:hypothetical protein ACFQBY_22025 [Promicromonospora citrea]|uniref:Uncharacterized protein n=1 Tax=Promicromonospora citrea TaxID=43677 RepID=A0A8H9GP65_9MICO|nr:hypothetical protein [Promicromonospora citrea]NNH54294.1 hypothetical protein [Promicromonospora citrea]GGM43404.1 hypothetical protein GCM10010102_43660 [Promicromonospora citrea]
MAHADRETGLTNAVDKLLGSRRNALAEIETLTRRFDDLTRNVSTVEVLPVPMKLNQVVKWRETARQRREDWVFVEMEGGTQILAIDEPSGRGLREPFAAVMYPALHTRLASWWLFHAWRSVDLLTDTLHSINGWRLYSAAVSARSLVEHTGCLLYESKKIAAAWAAAKAVSGDARTRAQTVHRELAPVLNQAGFGSRMRSTPEKRKATNVLTYVDKLSKDTGDRRFLDWYDWLSDAAHPALGARLAFASDALVHEHGGVMQRYYARSPMHIEGKGTMHEFEHPIFQMPVDALIACGRIVGDLLERSLEIVDDFGLTTEAATYTQRSYWRNVVPAEKGATCPCGLGPAKRCEHQWGRPAPAISVASR